MKNRAASFSPSLRLFVVGILLVGGGGCSVFERSPLVVPQTSPSLSVEPSSTPAASIDPADLARWVAFRRTYGLRSDVAWVTLIASDPANANELHVPLLPTEIDIVGRRNQSIQDLMPAVTSYGEGFPDYGGARIEGARAVILFRDGLDEHQEALDAFFGLGRIEVRKAPYSIADLEKFAAQVEAERAWFTSIGVELFYPEPYELTNTVRVRYIAKDRSSEPLILEHFGDPDWMTVKWYGPPAWAGPVGRLVVTIVDPAGRPLPGAADPTCYPVPTESSVGFSFLPKGTQGSGECVFDDVPAVAYDVEVAYNDALDRNIQVARSVVVPAGGTGSLTFVIDR